MMNPIDLETGATHIKPLLVPPVIPSRTSKQVQAAALFMSNVGALSFDY